MMNKVNETKEEENDYLHHRIPCDVFTNEDDEQQNQEAVYQSSPSSSLKEEEEAPLSWAEARIQLRSILKRYANQTSLLSSSSSSFSPPPSIPTIQETKPNTKLQNITTTLLSKNADLYTALLFSTSFLLLSSFSLGQRQSSNHLTLPLHANADLKVYKAQIASGVLLVILCLGSILGMKWRRDTCCDDGIAGKKRAVGCFLRVLEHLPLHNCDVDNDNEEEEEHVDNPENTNVEHTTTTSNEEEEEKEEEILRFPGTPLTDTYNVYRRSKNNNSKNSKHPKKEEKGEWHRIPALLLVQGDYIALQVGDAAPATCRLLTERKDTKGDVVVEQSVFVNAGERITTDTFSSVNHHIHTNIPSPPPPPAVSATSQQQTIPHHHFNNTSTKQPPPPPKPITTKGKNNNSNTIPSSLLPPNKSTLQSNSKELLILCNHMKVFVLESSPLDGFLKRRHCSGAKQKSPQVHRKANAIRSSLLHFAVVITILTTTILFARPHIFSSDVSLILPLPFLSCIALLPVSTPICAMFMEILGTARILLAVHPFASLSPSPSKSFLDSGSARSQKHQQQQQQQQQYYEERREQNVTNTIQKWSSKWQQLSFLNPEQMMFIRYVFATISSRFSTSNTTSKICSLFFFLFISPILLTIHLCSYLSKKMIRRKQVRRQDSFREYFDGCYDHDVQQQPPMIAVPPATSYMLEKLGVATALTLVDDELACEPHSTPQQLLIPSGDGLKLLDICPKYDDAVEMVSLDDNNNNNNNNPNYANEDSREWADSDDSDEEEQQYRHMSAPSRTLRALRRRYRYKRKPSSRDNDDSLRRGGLHRQLHRMDSNRITEDNEVQFEDPLWWQHLPSLKCIGLACLLVDDKDRENNSSVSKRRRRRDEYQISSLPPPPPHQTRGLYYDPSATILAAKDKPSFHRNALHSLVSHICEDDNRSVRCRNQLIALAQCIGFSTRPNSFGVHGDISPFEERKRLYCLSTRLLLDRMSKDTHALGLEESWGWGMLRPDATSVIIRDKRSKAYQLLTVGDARVVTEFCTDSWQGENSTILPLGSADRKSILDTGDNWTLSDLDVAAFSYAPVPHTLEQMIVGKGGGEVNRRDKTYLVDNRATVESIPTPKERETGPGDWSLVKNQIFLGLLGSAVRPRKEIEPFIEICDTAGVRFVYFSPRNMRRTKELASQMGIDVAWNCAISLRVLDEGQEDDHRMTSTYADWYENARLPHGVENVKRHLKEVDNVPLLVSLYTDVTKGTTSEMVTVFREYNDTVMAFGLSHLSQNDGIFSAADLAVGVDILAEETCLDEGGFPQNGRASRQQDCLVGSYSKESLLCEEVSFVSHIAAHSCIFNLKGSSSISYLPVIVARGRASLEAVTSAALFVVTSCISFALFVLFCTFSVATTVPFVPPLGSILFVQIIIPILGLTMSMTEADSGSMNRVPPKNDESITFAPLEGRRMYAHAILRALPVAIAPQILYLISFGELVLDFEPLLLETECSIPRSRSVSENWTSVIRCDALRNYSGDARTSAGSLMLAEFALCVIVSSIGFVFRTKPLKSELPWERNYAWLCGTIVAIVLLPCYLAATLAGGSLSALPWYYYVLALLMPILCLVCGELVKQKDLRHENRAVMMRRLQFETRLGMWSPKEN